MMSYTDAMMAKRVLDGKLWGMLIHSQNTRVKSQMENLIELGQALTLTEESMWGIGRIIEDMVKEHTLYLMDKSM